MSLLLSLIVLCTAVVGFFAQEIIHFLSKIFSIPGAKIFLPLFLASFIVEGYQVWGWWGLSLLRTGLSSLEHGMAQWVPLHAGEWVVARVLLLTLLASLPLAVATVASRKKPMSNARFFAYRFGGFLWVVSVIVLIT